MSILLNDGTPIAERWSEVYNTLQKWANDEPMDAHFCTCIEELSRAENREQALLKVLEDVVHGNDIAHERKHTLESWPDSTFRKRAVAILFPSEQQSAEDGQQ